MLSLQKFKRIYKNIPHIFLYILFFISTFVLIITKLTKQC